MPTQPQHRKLAIVGNSDGVHKSDVFEGDSEIWVLNGRGATLPRYDAVIEMHVEPVRRNEGGWSRRFFRDNETVPVYMRKIYPDVPMATAYPFKEVFKMTEHVRHRDKPLKYFTSSMAWAIALAILQERPVIELYGIDMQDKEYIEQKDCFAFWTGFAAGRGIQIDINCADDIFKKELYHNWNNFN